MQAAGKHCNVVMVAAAVEKKKAHDKRNSRCMKFKGTVFQKTADRL